MNGFVKQAIKDRASGKGVSGPRALVLAAAAGVAAAGVTYRVMRS
jgi:hypothetical protein